GHRPERAVLTLGGAARLEPGVERHPPAQLTHEARLPDPGLAGEEEGAAPARLRAPPEVDEAAERLAPPDQRRLAHERRQIGARARPGVGGHAEDQQGVRQLGEAVLTRSVATHRAAE